MVGLADLDGDDLARDEREPDTPTSLMATCEE